ncbi:hypothetical protein E2562_011930 [Oryza meyeriana var. granulata]|uniref:Uncharacterized protein n=1 Tax=Oryza meyeriana var. granulata TaxID=110450 RepID=A0A6G1CFN9_9ORYZ|nr:hypothetical protein E2562_011930 [Oryza meyeriana var. granulata]
MVVSVMPRTGESEKEMEAQVEAIVRQHELLMPFSSPLPDSVRFTELSEGVVDCRPTLPLVAAPSFAEDGDASQRQGAAPGHVSLRLGMTDMLQGTAKKLSFQDLHQDTDQDLSLCEGGETEAALMARDEPETTHARSPVGEMEAALKARVAVDHATGAMQQMQIKRQEAAASVAAVSGAGPADARTLLVFSRRLNRTKAHLTGHSVDISPGQDPAVPDSVPISLGSAHQGF